MRDFECRNARERLWDYNNEIDVLEEEVYVYLKNNNSKKYLEKIKMVCIK